MARIERWPYWQRALLFALVAFLITAVLETSDVFRRFDYDLSDAHGRLFAPEVKFDEVVVIDVDEDSLAQLQPKIGPWPYDRDIYALVTQWLYDAGVRAVAFDIVFSETRKGDDAFAAVLDDRVVLAGAALPFSFERDAAYRQLLQQKLSAPAPQSDVKLLEDLTLPKPQLAARAKIGVTYTDIDRDGVLRRTPLVYAVYGRLAPSLALALQQVGSPASFAVADGWVTLGSERWPVSDKGEVLLRYPKSLAGLRTLSFYQAVLAAGRLAGMEPVTDSLRGKRVIIGSSSAVLGDLKQTPLGPLPGLKLQAMVTALLAGGHVLKPGSMPWKLLLVACALLLTASMGHPRWQSRVVVQWAVFPLVILFVGMLAAIALLNGRAIDLLFAISAAVLAHLIGLLYQQFQLYRNNQRLEMEKRAATQADALKSQFLSHITHELRTPLTAIMGFNNINWHDSELGREQRMSNGEIVDRNCQHMLSLVNNLLDQAKLEAGQLTIQTHPDKLRAVIADAFATVQPLLRGKLVKLRTDEIDVPEYLDIDAFRLRQIVLNLLSNAIKFTETGEICLISAWHEGELTLSVIDTGPGMPAQALKRLFTAFGQADAGVAAKHGGTGLGLTISRNLARLMGGDIKVHSAVGKGTTFTVTIAAARAAAEGADQTAPQKSADVVRNVLQGTVLVAEDMPDTRALVVRHLEQFGLTVFQAANGEEAIEIALAKRPDVVLMDMEMPVVAGPEATRTLRMCGFSAPVLALTAQKDEVEHLRALAAGCNSVVEKPLTRSSLLTALSTALAPEFTRAHAASGVAPASGRERDA